MHKKISVIVPCYKTKTEYLDRLMDSLINQTIGLEHMEIFLIDDGSPDNTFALLKQYEEMYPDVICLIHYEENHRPGYARTLGIQSASGEYVAFADQDDWVEYTMYEELYEKAVAGRCDLASGYYTRDEVYEKPVVSEKQIEGRYLDICDEQQRQEVVLGKVLQGGYWSAIYRREFLLENQIFFPADVMWDDNFFGFLVKFYVKKCYIVDKCYYHWYLNKESISMSASYEQIKHRMQVEMLKIQESNQRGFLEKYQEEIAYSFFHMFYVNTLHVAFTKLPDNPYGIYQKLRQTVLNLFPHIDDNRYIKQYTPEVYERNMYADWENYVGSLDEEIKELCRNVPASIQHMSWMDTVYQELTSQELEGWKIRYLLVNIGF